MYSQWDWQGVDLIVVRFSKSRRRITVLRRLSLLDRIVHVGLRSDINLTAVVKSYHTAPIMLLGTLVSRVCPNMMF